MVESCEKTVILRGLQRPLHCESSWKVIIGKQSPIRIIRSKVLADSLINVFRS
jgi:hypothetical protein